MLAEVVGEAGSVAVIAAGGIASGVGVFRALGLGAAGAMLGTRFVATRESLAHEIYKRHLIDSTTDDAALTVCFNGGWPYAAHRVLRNSTLNAWEAAGCPPVGRRPGEGEIIGRLTDGQLFRRYEDVPPRIGVLGSAEAMPMYAGMGCGEINDTPSASAVVERLWSDCLSLQTQMELSSKNTVGLS